MNLPHLKSPLTGRISGFAPVLVALTLGWTSYAWADPATDLKGVLQTGVPALNLPGFATEEGKTATATAAITTVSAPATDLVYAVYLLAQQSIYNDNPTDLAGLVTAALQGTLNPDGTPKTVRADLNVVAPRVLHAALQGSGFTGDNALAVVTDLVNLNSAATLAGKPNTKVMLTAAGKEAVLAQAIKSAGNDANLAGKLGTLANTTALAPLAVTATQAAKDTAVQGFSAAVLKLVGTATTQVPAFAKAVLAAQSSPHAAFALKIAEGVVATNAAAAGGVIGGAALDIGSPSNDQLNTLLRSVFNDTKLAKAQNAALAAAAFQGTDPGQVGIDLFDGTKTVATFGKAVLPTTANKATVVSGVLQALGAQGAGAATSTQVQTTLNNLASKGVALKTTEYATFATTAAIGSGEAAGFLAADLITAQRAAYVTAPTAAVDTSNRTAIAVATLKAIALTAPNSGTQVAFRVISTANSTGADVFFTDVEKTTLAKALAKAVPTNGTLTAAAVYGVASTLAQGQSSDLASFVSAIASSAPTAVPNITKLIVSQLLNTTGASLQFATDISARIAVTYAPNALGGIAAADSANAGAIAAAGAVTPALKASTLTIATAVATNVNVDRVVDVAESIANLLKPAVPFGTAGSYNATADPKVPKITSIGTLATNLGKVIESKPLIPTVYRITELSELAATLTHVAVTKIPVGTTDAATAKAIETTLASIGTSIIGTLSATQLMDAATLAADKLDALQQIVGAIAQSVTLDPNLTNAVKHALLDRTVSGATTKPGALEAALLVKAATPAYKLFVTHAFDEVLLAFNDPTNTTHVVPGTRPISAGGTGKYATGILFEPETPVQNVL